MKRNWKQNKSENIIDSFLRKSGYDASEVVFLVDCGYDLYSLKISLIRASSLSSWVLNNPNSFSSLNSPIL